MWIVAAIGGGTFLIAAVVGFFVVRGWLSSSSSPLAVNGKNAVQNGNGTAAVAADPTAQQLHAATIPGTPPPTVSAKVLKTETVERRAVFSDVAPLPGMAGFQKSSGPHSGRLEWLRPSDQGNAVIVELEMTRTDTAAAWPSLERNKLWIGTADGEAGGMIVRDTVPQQLKIPNLTVGTPGLFPEVTALNALLAPVPVPLQLVSAAETPPKIQPEPGAVNTIVTSVSRVTETGPLGTEVYAVDQSKSATCDRESPYGRMQFYGLVDGEGGLRLLEATLSFSGATVLKDVDGTTIEGALQLGVHPYVEESLRNFGISETQHTFRMVSGELVVTYPAGHKLKIAYPDVSQADDPNIEPQAMLSWEAADAALTFTAFEQPEVPQTDDNVWRLRVVVPRPSHPGDATLHLGDTLTVNVALP